MIISTNPDDHQLAFKMIIRCKWCSATPGGRPSPRLPRPPHRAGARVAPMREVPGLVTRGTTPARRAGRLQTAERFLQILQPPAPAGRRARPGRYKRCQGRPHRTGPPPASASATLTAARKPAKALASRTLPRRRVADGTEFRHPKAAEMKGNIKAIGGRWHKPSPNTGTYAEASRGPLTGHLSTVVRHWHPRPLTPMTPSP